MHRVGRAGRMGQKGGLITNFVRQGDFEMAKIVTKQLKNPSDNWDKVLSLKVPRRKVRK